MSPLTITRQQLIDAVEAGIAANAERGERRFDREECVALREVAKTAQRVAYSDYHGEDACPMAQAFGLAALGFDRFPDIVFESEFDRAMTVIHPGLRPAACLAVVA